LDIFEYSPEIAEAACDLLLDVEDLSGNILTESGNDVFLLSLG
jgi:hypothetical protein